MNKTVLSCQLLVLGGCVIFFSTTHAESYYYPGQNGNANKIVTHACKDRIRENIWSDHRYIQKVSFTSGSFNFRSEGKRKTGMQGRGKFLNRKDRWKEFTFTCTYNIRRDEIEQANYIKSSNSSGDPEYSYNARRACKYEIDRKILNRHESASRIRWQEGTVVERRESRHDTNFSGRGRFVGGQGRYRDYKFQCTYNRNQDDVSNAWVDVTR